MGRASREKRDRRLVRAALNEFAPHIQEKARSEGRAAGLAEAAECKTIAEVRKLAKEVNE